MKAIGGNFFSGRKYKDPWGKRKTPPCAVCCGHRQCSLCYSSILVLVISAAPCTDAQTELSTPGAFIIFGDYPCGYNSDLCSGQQRVSVLRPIMPPSGIVCTERKRKNLLYRLPNMRGYGIMKSRKTNGKGKTYEKGTFVRLHCW